MEVYARGKIEYFDQSDAPDALEGIPTEVDLSAGVMARNTVSKLMEFGLISLSA